MICRLVDPTITPLTGALPDRPLEPTGAARIDESFGAIGWRPRIGLEEGLARTIDFYRKEGAN